MTLYGRGRVILAALLLGAFGAIAVALPERGGTGLDVLASEWLQARTTDAGAILFTWISWLGDTALTGLVIAAVLVLAHRRRFTAATTVAFASICAPFIDVALKQVFQRGRPDHAIAIITGTTWSFPSGHAMSSLVGYGVVAYFRAERESDPRRRLIIVVATCLIVAGVGFSRLYLGVHYLSDVAGGWLAGAVWLLACIEGYHVALRRRALLGHRRRVEQPDADGHGRHEDA